MLVERIMTSPCISILDAVTIEEALQIMNQHKIRHLPITNIENQLVGIVSDKDINLSLPSILSTEDPKVLLQTPISKIMQTNIVTCHPLDFVEDIAIDFYEENIGSIPVIKRNQLIGIVTQKDMLNTFIELTGNLSPGSTIQVQVPDVPGIMHSVTEVFHKQSVSIESILVYRDKSQEGYKLVTIRMKSMHPGNIIQALIDKGYKVQQPMDNGL